MSRKQAHAYFYASYCGKSHQIHKSDTFRLKIMIPDKNNLFATLFQNRLLHFQTRSLHFKMRPCPFKMRSLHFETRLLHFQTRPLILELRSLHCDRILHQFYMRLLHNSMWPLHIKTRPLKKTSHWYGTYSHFETKPLQLKIGLLHSRQDQ